MRGIGGKLLLAAAATLVALGAAEFAARLLVREDVALPSAPPLAPEDEKLPELRGVKALVEPNQRGIFKGVVHRTNSLGVRGPELRPEAAPGTFRIAVIGDSYTMGQGVAEEASYPAVAQQLLNARRDGRRYEVVNLGVAGLAIRHSMRRLERVGSAYRPHLLVYGFTPNDVMGPAYVEPTPEDREYARERIHRFDTSPSLLLRQVWPRLVLARSALWPLRGTYEYVLEENYFRNPEAAKQISDGLDALARIGAGLGACGHVFVHTRMNQLWIHPFTRIYRHVAESARARGLSAHVSYPFFRGRDVDALRISAIDSHPNTLGQRLHAEALLEGLDALPEHCWNPGHFRGLD